MKYVGAFLNFTLTYATGIVGGIPAFGFLIIMLNGFNESDAGYGINAYWIWIFVAGFVVAVASSLVGWLLAEKKKINPILSGLIAFLVFLVVQAVSVIAAIFIGILVTDLARNFL